MENSSTNRFTASTKFFWYSLLVYVLAGGILAFLGWYNLSFGADISIRLLTFEKYNNWLFYFNIITFLFMVLVAAYKHRSHNQSLFYIPPYLVFVLFSFVGYGILGEQAFKLRQEYGMHGGGFSVNGLVSIALSVTGVLFTVLVFVGVLMLKRRR